MGTQTTDKIEFFLDGQLKGKELNNFIAEMEQDKKLASEVAMHREINESIIDDEVYYLRQKLSLLIAKSARKLPFVKTISSVAAGLIIILSIVNITNNSNPAKAFTNFYAPYQTDLSTRSSENNLQGLSFAFKLYAEAEYETAMEMLNNYNNDNLNNSAINYYNGLCALELNKNERAAQSFQSVIDEGDYAYALHSKWYLSLLYLKTKQSDKAEVLLNELAEKPNFYAEKSQKILKKYF